MISDTPCSCGGNNENCFRCNGLGFYTKNADEIPPTEGVLLHHRPPEKPRSTTKNKSRKVYLRAVVPPSVSSKPSMASIYAVMRNDMVNAACPECGKLCKGSIGVRAHAKAVHGLNVDIKSPIITKKRLQNTSIQQAQIRSSTTETTRSFDPKKSMVKSSSTYHQIPNTIKPQGESKFDGSGGYYENYREDGKFGSHPNHDAYGDEDFA